MNLLQPSNTGLFSGLDKRGSDVSRRSSPLHTVKSSLHRLLERRSFIGWPKVQKALSGTQHGIDVLVSASSVELETQGFEHTNGHVGKRIAQSVVPL